MDVQLPKTGDLISIISMAEIRYEGRLHTVNTQARTIALTNGKFWQQQIRIISFVPFSSSVRMMGTEGRSIYSHIPPQQNYIETIIFSGEHIKEIQILSNTDAGNQLNKSQSLTAAEQEICKMFASMATSASVPSETIRKPRSASSH